MRWRTRIVFSGLNILLLSLAVWAQPQLQSSRFERTVRSLQAGAPELRADFAIIALAELTETYIAEADLARNEAETADRQQKLRDWSRAVDVYSAQLVLVLEDIELGLPVELRFTHNRVVAVAVGGRTVILAHPRASQQPAYEQRVLADFCTANNCKSLVAQNDELRPIPVTASAVAVHWEFSEDGPVCSHQGLYVYFQSGGSLPGKRSVCEQFMQEASILAAELAWQQRHGVSIDWNELSVRATPRQPEHIVQLNSAGDSLLVTIPLIYTTVGLLPLIEPWLRASYSYEPLPRVQLDATELGWE